MIRFDIVESIDNTSSSVGTLAFNHTSPSKLGRSFIENFGGVQMMGEKRCRKCWVKPIS